MTELPLIAIAEGRKPRLRRARVVPPKESRLHADVANLLRDHALPDWKWRHISGKSANAREGAIMKNLGVIAGWPDFILVSPYGSVRCLELKREEKSERTDEQEEFRMWCIKHGVPHVVAWRMDQVLAAFRWWNCTRLKLE